MPTAYFSSSPQSLTTLSAMPYGTYPRKTDRPPTYAPRRRTAPPWLRRARLIQVALVVLGMLLLWIVILAFRRHDTQELSPPDTPRTILVTSFDEAFRGKYERMIVDNRKMYARMHGRHGIADCMQRGCLITALLRLWPLSPQQN